MAVPSTFRLVRADDHVVAEVFISNLSPFAVTPSKAQPSPFVLRPQSGTGVLRVRFQAQQIVEYATPVGLPREVQPMPIFTAPTDVVVQIPANDPGIPLSVAGILEALGRLSLHVAGTGNTRFVLPHRLALRPHDTAVELRHLTQPALRAERVELWHSTLRRVTPNPAQPAVPVLLDAIPVSPNPIGSWAEIVNDGVINNALRFTDCVALANESQPPSPPPQPPKPPVPGQLHRLVLSSLGAWLDLRGSWPSYPEYQHRIAMGRDVSQRVVAVGRLFPFGHAAIRTSATTRDFETSGAAGNPTGRAAALSTVNTITVTQPEVSFRLSETNLTHAGWPYEKVTLLDRVTPPGNVKGVPDDNSPVLQFTVPGPGGAQVPYAFTCVGVDRTGQTTQFSMPLLFVPSDVSDAAMATLYNGLDAESPFKKIELGGQPLGVAPEIDPEEADARIETLERGRDADARTNALERDVHARAAAPEHEANARAAVPQRERATTVLASKLAIKLDAAGRPLMDSVRARVNALERYAATGPAEVLLRYAAPYTTSLFGGTNAQGQVFLQMGEKLAVDLGKKATASLATVGLPVAGLSREFGALAGAIDADNIDAQIADLAQGKIDFTFLDAVNKLFGVVPIKDLIPVEKLALGKNQKITTTMVNGVATTELLLDVPLLRTPAGADQPYRNGFVGLAPFRRNPSDAHDTKLRVHQTTTLDTATGVASSTSICTISSVALQLFAKDAPPNPDDEPDPADDGSPLVTVPFVSITFESVDGDKPEVDVDLGPVRFGGFLRFLGVLADLIDQQGFRDPPALAVDDTGVTSSFEFPIPSVAIGVFAIENITFATSLRLPFTDNPLTLGLAFAQRDNPFVVTVAALGGGGYLEIELSTGGLERIAGSIEFGARLSIDLFIAKASVEAMGGVYANYVKNQGIAVVAFFRIRGELEVLSLVSVSVTFTRALEYLSQGNQLFGKGEIAVNVTVVFFSETVVVPFERRFAGQNADPTFAELMAPETPGATSLPWDDYCRAFAAI